MIRSSADKLVSVRRPIRSLPIAFTLPSDRTATEICRSDLKGQLTGFSASITPEVSSRRVILRFIAIKARSQLRKSFSYGIENDLLFSKLNLVAINLDPLTPTSFTLPLLSLESKFVKIKDLQRCSFHARMPVCKDYESRASGSVVLGKPSLLETSSCSITYLLHCSRNSATTSRRGLPVSLDSLPSISQNLSSRG